jgi:hypothetical protein
MFCFCDIHNSDVILAEIPNIDEQGITIDTALFHILEYSLTFSGKAGSMPQVVECLPSQCKTLSSSHSAAK